MKKLLFVVLALALTSGLIFPPTQAGAAAKTEILIGAINSMTGVEAMVGLEHRWAYEQAVKDINAKGGIFVKDVGKKLPVKLVVADDQSNAAGASAAAEKLIKLDKVDFVLGSVDTAMNINGGNVAEKYKKLYVTTTFFPENFAEQKFTWVVDSFFSIAELGNSAAASLDPIPPAERPKNFCVLVEDNEDGQSFNKFGAAPVLEKYKYHVALLESYTPGSKDFSSSILRMKNANVDAIITLCSSTDGMTFIRQMKEANFAPKYVWGARGFWPIEFGEALGKDANYCISDGHWAEALGAPGSKALGDKYRAKYGADEKLGYHREFLRPGSGPRPGYREGRHPRQYQDQGSLLQRHVRGQGYHRRRPRVQQVGSGSVQGCGAPVDGRKTHAGLSHLSEDMDYQTDAAVGQEVREAIDLSTSCVNKTSASGSPDL